jgi:biopolymer transport protein ExbB
VLLGWWAAVPSVLAQTEAAGEPAAIGSPQGPAEGGPVTDQEPIPTKDMLSIVKDGGPLMIPIGLCSLILVAFVFERTISLRRGRVIPRPFVKRFLKQLREGELDRQKALALCQDSRSPVAEVFAGAVRKWGRPAVEVEQAIIDSGERVTNGLRRYLRVINGVATVTPLLGLLGTVVGMIRAFNNIATADALGRPELLAKGISEALLTTAAGLTVAIPALIFYLFFVSRVDRLIIDIDAMGQEVVNAISAEQLQSKEQRAPKPRRESRRGAAA